MSHPHSRNRRLKFIQLALTGHERILPTNSKYPAPRPEHAGFCKLFHFMEHVSMNILACWSLESILGPLLYCSHHSLEHSVLSACFQLDPLVLTLWTFLFYMSFDTTFTCFTCLTVSWFQRSGNPNPIPSIHYWRLSQQLSNKRRYCTKLHLLTHLQSVNGQDFYLYFIYISSPTTGVFLLKFSSNQLITDIVHVAAIGSKSYRSKTSAHFDSMSLQMTKTDSYHLQNIGRIQAFLFR